MPALIYNCIIVNRKRNQAREPMLSEAPEYMVYIMLMMIIAIMIRIENKLKSCGFSLFLHHQWAPQRAQSMFFFPQVLTNWLKKKQ